MKHGSRQLASGTGRACAHGGLASLASLAIMVLALAACTAPAPDPVRAPRPPETAGLPAPDPAPASEPAPAFEAPAARSRPTPATPGKVMGMDRAALVRLLGPPHLRRRGERSDSWQYRQPGCVLELFLYPGSRPGQWRVVYYELRDRNQGLTLATGAAQRCFNKLVTGRAAG